MARRFQEITEVYRQEIAALARADRWTAFLRSACRNYKLPFEEQVLVHAQRPDATAVLEIERWNRQFGRWVNKGATGIAVFDRDYPGRTHLKYYFDISDTHESRLSRPVPLWQVPTEQEPDVIEALENRFGALDDKGTLEEAIVSAMENAAADNMTDYLDDLQNCRDNSLLEELDELNLSVLYADDFKLFCRKRSDAEKVFIAVKLWLQDRLKLEISEEKSKIVNLKRHYSKFLGFEMKAVKKRKRYVVKSHMTEKAISKETAALIEQVKQIAHVQDRDDEAREITLYNSMVFGIHNYYRYATMIATDCEQIHRAVSTVMKNRLYGRLTKKGQINEVYIRKNYGDSKQIRFISSKTVAPVGYIQTKTPLFKKKKVCKYTPEGRAEIHKNLGINTSIMLALMRIKEPRRSVEYMDNRISLYAAQYGRCAVTGKELWLDEIHCHHKQPLCRGGTDKYMNLVIVHRDIHRLIHATDPNTIVVYLNLFQLDKKALAKLNALRVLTGQPEI